MDKANDANLRHHTSKPPEEHFQDAIYSEQQLKLAATILGIPSDYLSASLERAPLLAQSFPNSTPSQALREQFMLRDSMTETRTYRNGTGWYNGHSILSQHLLQPTVPASESVLNDIDNDFSNLFPAPEIGTEHASRSILGNDPYNATSSFPKTPNYLEVTHPARTTHQGVSSTHGQSEYGGAAALPDLGFATVDAQISNDFTSYWGDRYHELPDSVLSKNLEEAPISSKINIENPRMTSDLLPFHDLSTVLRSEDGYLQAPVALGPCSKVWELPKKIRRRGQLKSTKINTKSKCAPRKNVGQDTRRRGAFVDQHTRDMTALTRNLKSCIRCRIQRIRCYPDPENITGPCLTCARITRPTMSRLGCLRYKITDAALFREQVAPNPLFSRRWKSMDLVDITDWASDETKTIEISQVYLDCPYKMKLREFRPKDGDMLEEKWTSGSVIKTHQIPPYAIANMEKAAETLREFVDQNILTYIHGTIGHLDPFLMSTYLMAFRHSYEAKSTEERCLLSDTFRLWVACRKTSNPERIYGNDQLGVSQVDDPSSPWFAYVPMPPILIAQQECIMFTKFLLPLRKSVVDRLNAMVLSNKRNTWFTIYLVNFVLLHSCSMITRRNEEFARQISLLSRFTNPHAIRAHHSGALTLLAHFHYINKGKQPFTLAQTAKGLKEVATAAELTEIQKEFWRGTTIMVQQKSPLMKQARDAKAVGSDWYWISQLYDDEWVPPALVV